MRRGWLLLLLLSVGLNLGLGYALLSQRTQAEDTVPGPARGSFERALVAQDTARIHEMLDRHFERVADRIGLPPELREDLRRTRRAALPRMWQRRQAVDAARRRLHRAFVAEEIRPDSVALCLRELNAAQAGLDSLVSTLMLEEMRKLSPEQRRAYLEHMPLQRPGPPGPGPRDPGRGRRHGGGPRGRGSDRP
jgi:hypothetical protein